MTATLSILLSVIFTLLSAIHFYWLSGGQWGVRHVIPTKSKDVDIQAPPKFATLLVALILMVFGFFYLVKSGVTGISISHWILSYVYWGVPSVFILRAIGEFKYVGFFKTIKDTEFAKSDSKWFSPLCLIVGVVGILIQLMDT